MNEKQALQDVENVLRDFISSLLEKKFGLEWHNQCGLPDNRINQWNEKLVIEHKKQKHSTCDPRLIYYADFYDLKNILSKNWDLFSNALGEKREIDALLSLIENYRNSNAHGRELLSYQKHLVIGIAGEIRNRITKFRSMQDTGESYFPRIESAHDNFGNSWKPGDYNIRTPLVLREGAKLEFVVSATDPKDEQLEYRINGESDWQTSNHLHLVLSAKHIRQELAIAILTKSSREYHARDGYDDGVIFMYQVLPNNEFGYVEPGKVTEAKVGDSSEVGSVGTSVDNFQPSPSWLSTIISRLTNLARKR